MTNWVTQKREREMQQTEALKLQGEVVKEAIFPICFTEVILEQLLGDMHA